MSCHLWRRPPRRACGFGALPVSTYSAEPAPSAALLGETGASVSGEPEPPAAAPQSEEMEAAPRSQEMERAYEGTARGSIESLGRWKEKRDDRAMPPEMGRDVRRAFGKFVDELVQNGASSGILAITGRDISWSASPDDTSYQRHGVYESSLKAALAKEEWWASLDLKTLTTQLSTAMQNEHYDDAEKFMAELNKWKEFRTGRAQHDEEVRRLKAARAEVRWRAKNRTRFADFEGVVDDFGEIDAHYMAVYRVTLPSGGLDADKWAGRPPPPAPEDLYTGPRRDGLLSTGEISGDYRCGYFPFFGHSMTVVPHGPDMIETWSTCCFFLLGPLATGGVRTRDPGTNAFREPQSRDPNRIVTFSADGTAKEGCGNFKKRPGSQKRTFQKVDARDLAGKWWSCCCIPFGPPCLLLSTIYPVYCTARRANCTAKTALNEDQYEESGFCCCCLGFPESFSGTRTRRYVNGHPTNGFALDKRLHDIDWYRDPGCAGKGCFLAKKVG